MDPRKKAREEQKKIEQRKKSGDFTNMPRLPKFTDGEERLLRIMCAKEALKWLIDNPEKNHDDYTEEVVDAVGCAWKYSNMHFGVGSGGAALPCLKQISKPCPVCEAYDEDIKSDSEAIKNAASQIRCQNKTNFFVEWRGHEDEGPFVWTLADQWADMVMGKIANNHYKLIYDPFIGRDLIVTRHGTGQSDTRYDIDMHPDESFLYETIIEEDGEEVVDFDFEKGKRVLAVLDSISEYNMPQLSYEQYKAILEDEMTAKEAYKEMYSKAEEDDDGTSFDPEKIEKEEKEEKKDKPKRRRRTR